MTQPKLTWERKWFAGNGHTTFVARSHHLNMFISERDGDWFITAFKTSNGDAGSMCGYLLNDERSYCRDAVDAMAMCERRVHEVVMAEFGEFISGGKR